MKNKLFSLFLSFCLLLSFTACKQKEVTPKSNYEDFTVTIFSDIHYGKHNYNNFLCTKGLDKLGKIIDETPNSNFYISLGDLVDNMEKSTKYYDDIVQFLKTKKIEIYNTDKYMPKDTRVMYSLMGNHEANTYPKADLAHILPYEEGIGQVFYFKYEGVLFVAIDGNFSSVTGNDAMADMYCTTFTIPQAQVDWFKNVIDENLDEKVEEVVIISHIASKNFSPQSVFWELIDYVDQEYNTHVTMFDGHTHAQAYNDYTHEDTGVSYFTEYTLPAATANNFYDYYTISFKNGKVADVNMFLNTEM